MCGKVFALCGFLTTKKPTKVRFLIRRCRRGSDLRKSNNVLRAATRFSFFLFSSFFFPCASVEVSLNVATRFTLVHRHSHMRVLRLVSFRSHRRLAVIKVTLETGTSLCIFIFAKKKRENNQHACSINKKEEESVFYEMFRALVLVNVDLDPFVWSFPLETSLVDLLWRRIL